MNFFTTQLNADREIFSSDSKLKTDVTLFAGNELLSDRER